MRGMLSVGGVRLWLDLDRLSAVRVAPYGLVRLRRRSQERR